MAMPKASMDKDSCFPPRKYQIGRPRKVASVQTIAVAKARRRLAHSDFRLRVLATDAAHHPGPGLGGQDVHGASVTGWVGNASDSSPPDESLAGLECPRHALDQVSADAPAPCRHPLAGIA